MKLTPEIIDLAHALQALLSSHHQGRDNGLTCEQLARRFACPQRSVRLAVQHLRTLGVAIGAEPSHGYYWITTPAELECAVGFLYARAITTLVQISKMQRIALPEVFGQLRLQMADSNQEA